MSAEDRQRAVTALAAMIHQVWGDRSDVDSRRVGAGADLRGTRCEVKAMAPRGQDSSRFSTSTGMTLRTRTVGGAAPNHR